MRQSGGEIGADDDIAVIDEHGAMDIASDGIEAAALLPVQSRQGAVDERHLGLCVGVEEVHLQPLLGGAALDIVGDGSGPLTTERRQFAGGKMLAERDPDRRRDHDRRHDRHRPAPAGSASRRGPHGRIGDLLATLTQGKQDLELTAANPHEPSVRAGGGAGSAGRYDLPNRSTLLQHVGNN